MTAIPDPYASRLLSLPGELRNRIYRLTATHPEPIQITADHDHPEDARIYFSPQAPALALACHMTYNDIRPIFFEENTFEFSEHALRENRLRTFRKQAGDSAEKLTAITIIRNFTMGFFKSTAQFTAQSTDAGVVLLDCSYYYENFPLGCGTEGDSDDEGEEYLDMCFCRLEKAAAASNGNVLAFLEEYLEIDGVWKGQKPFLSFCYQCKKQIITCRKDWRSNPGTLWSVWDTTSSWPFDVPDEDDEVNCSS